MKRSIYLASAVLLLLFGAGCDKEDTEQAVQPGPQTGEQPAPGQNAGIPEGYFEVLFTAPPSRAPVTGPDTRVRDVRYLLFTAGGVFVKERHLVNPADPLTTWPLTTVRDTLPKGSYRAVFLGNVERTLFPYALPGSPVNYAEVLSGYRDGYAAARIALPPAQFTATSEYYLANVTFSDVSPNPYILLQRIVGILNMHRNFVDAQTALNSLTENIFSNADLEDQLTLQVQSVLPGLIREALDLGPIGNAVYALLGGLDAVVNALVSALVEPVTDALYELLVEELVNQIGIVLTGNADQSGLLAFLGVLLNPWATSEADSAVVTINNFPKSVDFDLNVQSVYTGLHKFKYKFTGNNVYSEKDIVVEGFSGLYDIRRINVVKTGLIAGVVLDGIVDGPWLLNGTFIDIEDPLQFTARTNRRFKSNYSFVDLGLKSYNPQTQTPQPLSLTINLGSIPNLDDIVKGIPLLGPILNTTINTLILTPLKRINVTVPVNLPLLGVENLSLSGGWQTPTAY